MSRKGENIYKRKDNRWEARFIKGYTAEGSARYGYCYASSYKEAKVKAANAKSALKNGMVADSGNGKKRLYPFCDEWLLLNRSRMKESTYVKYVAIAEKYIKPSLGGCLIRELSSLQVATFSRKLLNDGLAPKTVRDILTALHSILKFTQKQVPNMPYVEIFYPKSVKKEIRTLSREEQVRFSQYLLKDMDECKFGVLLALLTGLRIGEICALRWHDISQTKKLLRVSTTVQRLKNLDQTAGEKTKIIFGNPKSNLSARLIPLTDCTAELCKCWQVDDPNAYVLTGNDHFMEPRVLQYRLRKYTRECGLDGVHFHVLRHTFATRCVEVGFEIKSLSEILGHSSPKFTLERYVHSSMELKRENMNKLQSIGF